MHFQRQMRYAKRRWVQKPIWKYCQVYELQYTRFGFVIKWIEHFFLQWFFQTIQGPGLLFSSVIIFHRRYDALDECQSVTRPLPKHRTTQTQNKRIHTSNIHALSRIRTHDPSVRASADSSCLRPLGYCDRRCTEHLQIVITSNYSAIANSHTLQFTTARAKPFHSPVSPPVAAW
jgi:hypothetical protein